ncbi:hypothetical protein J9303_17805 [Bacillaceae bacterium Marseille-Q3522]|nr:hypothetical protein [Bacillaceae bacterium Marseille-Q3522]
MIRKINLVIEIKSMKAAFYFPLFCYFVILLQFIFVEKFEFYQFWLLEFFFVPLSSWWTVFLFYEYFEENNAELLFSYPVSAFFHGVARVVIFFLLYLMLLVSLMLVICLRFDKMNLLSLCVQYIPEAVFFSGISFVIVIVSKNILIPLIVNGFYVASEYFAKDIFPWYHVMFFNQYPLDISEVYVKSSITLLLGILCFFFGHLLLKKQVEGNFFH